MESDNCYLSWHGSVSNRDSIGLVWPMSAANGDKEGSYVSDKTPSILSHRVGGFRQERSSAASSAVLILTGYWLYASSAANL